MVDKRIGIISFQRAHNYGAILQVYSLQELLKQYFCHVSVIDYYPEAQHFYHYSENYSYSPLHPKKFIKNLLFLPRRKRRYDVFNSFIDRNIELSENVLSCLHNEFDTIIIGSDQVWNPKNSKGKYDPYYWGQFKKGDKPRIVSYAASMGNINNADWTIVSGLLGNFDAISVRENFLRDAITERCGLQAEWVLDPTLLHERSFFDIKAIKPKIRRPYLFFYQARADREAYRYAKKQAKEMGLEFIYLSAHIMLNNHHKVIGVGPAEFLGLIKEASYVITTSFHGTVFCYHFKKQFSTLRLNDGDNGRSESLLSLLGLERKLIRLTEKPNTESVDWESCDKRLDLSRKHSINWLLTHLNS